MKKSVKSVLSLLLAAVICPSVAPFALAGEIRDDGLYYFKDRDGTELKAPLNGFASYVVENNPGDLWTKKTDYQDPKNALGYPESKEYEYNLGAGGTLVLGFDNPIYDGEGLDIYVFEVGGDVEATEVEVSNDLVTWYDVGKVAGSTAGIDINGKVPDNAFFRSVRLTDLKTAIYSSWPGADIKGVSGLNSIVIHDYAAGEIDPIIIPPDFPDDWTQPITRKEFAAVCVQVYENLSGTKALPDVTKPFTDCTDIEVLKAYNVGITNGTSATTFSPDRLLSREEAATMLTRVFKRVTMAGWTLANDKDFTLNYTMPALFNDDSDISAYARDSVYFMASNEIIKGFPGNKFVPRNRTSVEEANHYANATREQALVIATRMIKNLQ